MHKENKQAGGGGEQHRLVCIRRNCAKNQEKTRTKTKNKQTKNKQKLTKKPKQTKQIKHTIKQQTK